MFTAIFKKLLASGTVKDMGETIKALADGSDDHEVEPDEGWLTLRRKPGRRSQFNALARKLVNDDGLAVFPRLDEQGDYDMVCVVPLGEGPCTDPLSS